MGNAKKITIRMPDDLHVHLRDAHDPDHQQDLLDEVVGFTARMCDRALVMPNTKPAILTAEDVVRYRDQIKSYPGTEDFEPLMTTKLTPTTTPQDIRAYKSVGTVACKLYPAGATTNSHGGVTDVKALRNTYAAMADMGLVLCVHGETPGAFSLEREEVFLPQFRWLVDSFPRLKIVLEHVTSAAAVNLILSKDLRPDVAATITPHHLLMTLDDVVGPPLRPHHYCLPLPKFPADQNALVRAALSGNPRFFLGTDSAPHIRERKECEEGCAGAFTSPVALQLLMSIFEQGDAVERLEDFTSRFGAEFYGLPLNTRSITLRRKSWRVPEMYGRVVPYMAKQTLEWEIDG